MAAQTCNYSTQKTGTGHQGRGWGRPDKVCVQEGRGKWFFHQKADMRCRPRKGNMPNTTTSWSGAGVPSKSHYREPYWYCTRFPVKSLRSKPIRWAQNVPGGSQLWTTWVLREGSPLGQKMEEKAALPEVSKELPRGRRIFRNKSPYYDLQLLCPTCRNSFKTKSGWFILFGTVENFLLPIKT